MSITKKGFKLSEEHKRKLSIAHKGKHYSPETEFKNDWSLSNDVGYYYGMRGKHHSEETKKKIGLANSIALKGRKRSEKERERISNLHKGKKLSEEHKRKISESKKGKKMSGETKRKMSEAQKGRKITWGDKLSESHKKRWDKMGRKNKVDYRKRAKYKNWRKDVFMRDDFTCVICGQVGGYLQAHHIKGWAKYQKLRYDIDNGISLCLKCHKKIHSKTRQN